MARVLFFDSNYVAELRKVKVKDGVVEIDGKQFFVDETKPLLLKTPLGVEPLYLVKWDSVYPAKIETKVETKEDVKKVKDLSNEDLLRIKKIVEGDENVKVIEKTVNTQLIFERDRDQTPESLYKSTKLKILGGMLKVKRAGGGLLTLIIGLIFGMIVTFMLFYLKIIRI